MSNGESFDVDMNDPQQVGPLLQKMAERINALQAACEVLTIMHVASFKTFEDLYGWHITGPGPMAYSMIDLFDKAIEKLGPQQWLQEMRAICGKEPPVKTRHLRVVK